MKNIAAIALVIAATFFASGPAQAQDNRVKATVPFNFTVGDNTLPAGTYTIGSSVNSSDILTLKSWENRVNVMTLGHPDQNNPKNAEELVFHKYGAQYFLSDIRSSNSAMNIHLATTKAEKRARKQVEEAGLFVDDPVLIALN
jgi:hypothetical protein